jgi:hypothetical protein
MSDTKDNNSILETPISRRTFIKGAGIGLGAVAGAMVLTGASDSVITDDPLPYKQLDPEEAFKRGHEGYHLGGCAYGSYYAIMSMLREKIGAPYNNIPWRTLRFGGAGVAGWGTLCGVLTGTCAAIANVVPNADITKLTNEMLYWYSNTPIPTDEANTYAKKAKFTRTKKEYIKDVLPQSISNSPLCHASVAKWCQEANIDENDPKRAERCGRATADAVKKCVELLNAYFAGTFKPSVASYITTESQACLKCHTPDVGSLKMDCFSCHDGH